jgi:hypothetical protein
MFPFGEDVVDNIRMDLGEVGWGDVDWIGLVFIGNLYSHPHPRSESFTVIIFL